MYLTKAPRYQNIFTDQYETIPIEDIALIDKYYFWTMLRAEGKTDACTMEEWCGISESKLPHKYVVNHYCDYFTEKRFYNEHWGDTSGFTIFTQLSRIVKANQIFRWFIENVMEGKPDREYHEITEKQLLDLLFTCKTVRKGFKLIEHDEYCGDKYAVNEIVAIKYLPLIEEQGYFFGTNQYDSNYAKNVIEMIAVLETVLKTTDFAKETVYFNATW